MVAEKFRPSRICQLSTRLVDNMSRPPCLVPILLWLLSLFGCSLDSSGGNRSNVMGEFTAQSEIIAAPFASYAEYAKTLAFGSSAKPSDVIAVGQAYYDLTGGTGIGKIFLYRNGVLWGMINEPEELSGGPPSPVMFDDCPNQTQYKLSQSRFASAIASNGKFIFVGAPGACELVADITGVKSRRQVGRVFMYDIDDPRFPTLVAHFDPLDPSKSSIYGGFGDVLAANDKFLAISNSTQSNSQNVSDGAVYITLITAAPGQGYTQLVPVKKLPPDWRGTFGRSLAITSNFLYVSEESDYTKSPIPGQATKRSVVHVYRVSDMMEVTAISDPAPGPNSKFGAWLTADGEEVYTAGDEVVYGLKSGTAMLVVGRPDVGRPGDIVSSFGTAVAASDQWIAVSAPYAQPHALNQSLRGYVALYRKSDLTKPERIYSPFPCLHQEQPCLRVAGYPGVLLALAGDQLFANDPSFAPSYPDEAGTGLGAIYRFQLPSQ